MCLKVNFSLKIQYVIIILSLYFTAVLNQPVLAKIFKLSHHVDSIWFPISAPILLFSLFLLIFTLLSIPYLFKPLVILLILSSAAATYAVSNYGILLDTSVMESVFETNPNEALTYVNFHSVLYFSVCGVLPSAALALIRIDHGHTATHRLMPRMALFFLGAIGTVLVLSTSYKDYVTVGRNNHYLSSMVIPAQAFNGIKYLKRTYFTTPLPYVSLGDDATITASANKKPTLVVMILGEAARAQDFHYDGYARNTNPYTEARHVISLGITQSCGTYTALSVPCMFSNLTREEYDKAKFNARDTLVNVIAKAGVQTLWIDNDGGDKGVVRKHAFISLPDSGSAFCQSEFCYDEGLIAPMVKFINEPAQNKFIVLHAIGSHGPTYWERYPKKMETFKPSCDKDDIENCSDQEIRNVYDNTILYTDYVIAKVIDTLKTYQNTYNVALMYMPDHGESLGENGLYLHGTPYAIAPYEQTHVPWLLWLPKQYAEQKHINTSCVSTLAAKEHLSQDNLFHSLLGLYGIHSSVISPTLNIFQPCLSSNS